MTSEVGSERTVGSDHPGGEFGLARWVRANAIGLAAAFGLLAFIGGGLEEWFGVDHDSLVRDSGMMVGLLAGTALLVAMRRRALAPHIEQSLRMALAAGAALVFGFIVGAFAGLPFGFVLGVISLGTIGGALQWRIVRGQLRRPGGLLLANIGGWILAGVAGLMTAILAGDAIGSAFGSDTAGFVAVLSAMGLIGGTVGGLVEGAALRRRINGAV